MTPAAARRVKPPITMALLSLIPLGLTGWIFWATVCRTGGPCS